MARFIKAATTDEVADQQAKLVELEGQKIALFRVDGASLLDVRDNVVYLQMGGGCQGCGMVDVTLKQGIPDRGIPQRSPEARRLEFVVMRPRKRTEAL